MKALVVVDMQNDFLYGSLANAEGRAIIPEMADYIKKFDGDVFATRDTHTENYMNTQEGKYLPVPHCIKGSEGWYIEPTIAKALYERPECRFINKPTFGSAELGQILANNNYDEVELCGVCTDICVISNALLIKAYAPEVHVSVIENLCAGVTPTTHHTALNAMKACQIDIIEV